jgi:CheY-like chemotaxis protein
MLADDDADDRMLFEEAVNEVNGKIKTISSIDGVQLMDALLDVNFTEPDIIFLDINMPKKNGLECLEQIRLSPKLKNIPVVIYSTCSQKDTINKAMEFGANFFIKKPDNFDTLKKILKKILTRDFSLQEPVDSFDYFVITL